MTKSAKSAAEAINAQAARTRKAKLVAIPDRRHADAPEIVVATGDDAPLPRATDKEVKAARTKAAAKIGKPKHKPDAATIAARNEASGEPLTQRQEADIATAHKIDPKGIQVAMLKNLAKSLYDDDEGVMYETFDEADYVAAIEEHKMANAAWAAHCGVVEIKKDHQMVNEAREEKKAHRHPEWTAKNEQKAYTITTEQLAKDLDVPVEDVTKHVKQAPAIPTGGYQGPMLALRQRLKAGQYKKAANGQPSCGDEVAQILGALEPTEVIAACLIAMDITNPYLHLNIGQQSMNLRNKLRGKLKHGEFGMGVLREAAEEVVSARPVK